MKKYYTLLISSVTALFFGIAAVALENDRGELSVITSVPREMSYQGILKDSGGDPVTDSTYTVTFRIFDTESGGSFLWEQTSPCTTSNGLFTTVLDNVDLAFDVDYWLELEVDSEILDPRQKFTMSAYCARSDTSDVSIDIIDNAITSSKIEDGTIQFIDIGQNGASAGQVMKWNGSAWVARSDSVNPNSGWIDNGSNVILTNIFDKVGIGVETPTEKLDVGGDIHVQLCALIGSDCYVDPGNYGQIVAGRRDSVYGNVRSSICGGENNIIRNSDYGFIGNGYGNIIDSLSPWATISGGRNNIAADNYATVGGGVHNRARGYASVVSGGGGYYESDSCAALAGYSVIAGGIGNIVSGFASSIGGGADNRNAGEYSVIPGGIRDTITTVANYSMVFGRGVYLDSPYSVAFFDEDYSGSFGINRDDRDGGINYPIHIGTSSSNGNGAYLTNGGVWTDGSGRSFRENLRQLSSEELLSKISNISVTEWNFIDSYEKHIGPMAEDFVAAFDVGVIRDSDGRRENQYLAAGDVAGVALAGVKELIEIVNELREENKELKSRIEELESKTR